MNILGLISQLIGIKTLRLTYQISNTILRMLTSCFAEWKRTHLHKYGVAHWNSNLGLHETQVIFTCLLGQA